MCGWLISYSPCSNQSRLEDGNLTGVFAGDLSVADANRRPYQLHLDAKLRGDILNGSVAAISLPAPRAGNALSYWIELQRLDADPHTHALFKGRDLTGWRVVDKYDFSRHGQVTVENDAIVLHAGKPGTAISVTDPFPRIDYEVAFEAKRMEGSDFFCGLTFPVEDDYLTLVIGGWGGGVTGISNLDDNSAVENETTGYTDFEQDRWYKIRLRVTSGHVAAWLDDEQIVNVDTQDRRLSIWWEQEPVRPFGIASWYTKAAIRRMTVKRIQNSESSSQK